MHLIIHTDGGARGNPGPAAAGVCIVDAATGDTVHEAGYYLGEMTNNVAEYAGLIRALDKAIELDAERVSLRSDSQLMVRQIYGRYRVKSAALKPLYQQVMGKLNRIGTWDIEHVGREANQRADQLANAAMDAGFDINYA